MYYYGNMYNWGQQFNKLYWIQQQINDIELRQGNMDFAQTIGYKGSFEQYKYSFSRQKYDAKWYANTESETRLLYDAYKTIQGMREQITGQKINYRLYASLGRGQERHIGYVEVAGDNLHKFITQEATALRINESAVRKAIRQKENEMKIAKAGFASIQRASDMMRYDKSTEAINKIYSGLLGQNIIQSQETSYTYTKKDGGAYMFPSLCISGFLQFLQTAVFTVGYISGAQLFPEPLSSEEEAMYLERLSTGDEEARNILIERNLRLVAHVCKKYSNSNVDQDDLISIGTIGLIKAIEKFDTTTGYKLSTYATWWIKQSISRALTNQARTVRIPAHLIEKLSKINKAKRELEQEFDREPSAAEIATVVGMTEEKVTELLKVTQPTTSLETPVGEEDTQLGDLIADEDNVSVEDQAEHTILKAQVSTMLGTLTDREREVVVKRFGLDGNAPKTLEGIGDELGVTRERIRQIEAKALRKLRHPSRAKKLKDFMVD